MPFIPHTTEEESHMLATLGVQEIAELFDEIPPELRVQSLNLPPGQSEKTMLRQFADWAKQDQHALCFLGAGAYKHHIPAAVLDLVSRGEFMTAYTPYQAEASQGALQVIYEFQSMITALTGTEVANASVYDGATALAEGILMAIRHHKESKRALCLGAIHPSYIATVKTIVEPQAIVVDHQEAGANGQAKRPDQLDDYAVIVIAQPNFYGVLEAVDQLTDAAHAAGALVLAVVNPMTLGVLKPPGEWGERGADIVVGEGQPLGVPIAGGGPYFGFMCTRQSMVRQLPGRIVGRTLDAANQPSFTLTLQTREQHIRRARATSNICTNQGLLVVIATIYMSLMGAKGIRDVGHSCHANAHALHQRLCRIKGVEPVFKTPFFHEFLLRLPSAATPLAAALAEEGILAGLPVSAPELGLPADQGLLLCATELIEAEDIERFAAAVEAKLQC